MTLLQLQYFRELGKTLHYTKAAEHLHISQPGLSYSISELEKELGSKLFEKKNRKFQLTPAGQVFMQYVEQALDTITTGVDAFHAVVDSTEERVALGVAYEKAFDQAAVKAAAQAAGMTKPTSDQIEYIELGGADMAEICRPESTGPLAQAWTWLKDGIGAVVEYFR